MGLKIYKPNSKNTGCACHFQVSSSTFVKAGKSEPDFAVFLQMVRQKSWDDAKKTGSFDINSKVIIKLDPVREVGGMIHVLDNRDPVKDGNPSQKAEFFHKTKEGNKVIRFQKSMFGEKVIYSLVVTGKDKEIWRTFFDEFEGETVKAFLKFSQERIFTGMHALDKQGFQKGKKTNKKDSGAESEIEEVEGHDDFDGLA